MAKQTVRVVARVVALPDKVEEVKSILLGLIGPTRQEGGCIFYELMQNQAEPTDFVFVEEWETQGLLEAHLASAHVEQAQFLVGSLVAMPPDIRRYQLLA